MSKSSVATLAAEKRTSHGKGSARALRRAEKVPAIVYSKGREPLSLALPYNALILQYRKGRFQSHLVELDISGEKIRALPQEVQLHPVTDKIEHVDFIRVEKGVAMRVKVPVKFLNQEKSTGLKRGGVLNIVRHEVEFLCDPDAIPEQIEVDIADLDIGDSVHINDIRLPAGITATIKRNFTVATIAGRSAAEEDVATTAAAATTAEGAAAPAAEGAAASSTAAAAPAKDKK